MKLMQRENFIIENAIENQDFNHIFDYDKICILRPSTSK